MATRALKVVTGDCEILLASARVGQHVFAQHVLANCGGRCVFCGLNPAAFGAARMLLAGHIKPWKDSTPAERLDLRNGLAAWDLAYYRRHGYIETQRDGFHLSSANGWTPDCPNRADEDVGLSHYPGGRRSRHGEAVQRGLIPATFALRP